MNHLTEEQLVLHYYRDARDPSEAAAIEQHLHDCAACQADLAAIGRTLEAVERLSVPARPDGYGTEVWTRVQTRLATSSRRPWWQAVREQLTPTRLALAGGVAVLVVAAFVGGRFFPGTRSAPPTTPGAASTPAATQQTAADLARVRERVFLAAVGDHLERSQMALVELVNAEGGPQVDISDDQRRVRELVSSNRLYRQTAVTTGDHGVAEVLDELERVLVEIANSPSTISPAEFEKVRDRIEQQGLIFKVHVLGERVRQREARPPREASHRG